MTVYYINTTSDITTNLPEFYNNSAGKNYAYGYDSYGNITSITENLSDYTSFTYDKLGQLVRENNQKDGHTYVYTYDDRGNITSKKTYAYTTATSPGTATSTQNYTYQTSGWRDILTGMGSRTFTSDAIGNRTSDGTWTYTWEHGRQLASMAKTGTTINYTYDADGVRTSKKVGSTTYNYYYRGGKLMEMTWGSDRMHFYYDGNGAPFMLTVNGTNYYYIRNAQGDVTAIIDSSGTIKASYNYDAWGNQFSVSVTDSDLTNNPLRYRGYVYDTETGLYYLQSRYYDPEVGRFICGDEFVATGQGFIGNNMFSYCLNSPVLRIDPTGEDAIILLDDQFPSHIGALVQDSDGVWWHFYWGTSDTFHAIAGYWVEPKTWCVQYDGDTTLDAINASNQYDNYEGMIRLPGDFSSAVNMFIYMDDYYNLYVNNCAQVTLRTLARSNTIFQKVLLDALNGIKNIIPENVFDALLDSLSTRFQCIGSGRQMQAMTR